MIHTPTLAETLFYGLLHLRDGCKEWLFRDGVARAARLAIIFLALGLAALVAFSWLPNQQEEGGDTPPLASQRPVATAGEGEPSGSLEKLAENLWFGVSPKYVEKNLVLEQVTVETTLNLELKGTILGEDPRALIRDNEKNITHLVRRGGEVLPGVTLAEVARRRVVLDNHGKLERLSLPGAEYLEQPREKASKSLSEQLALSKPKPYQLMFERPVERRVQVRLPRSEVSNVLANLGALEDEAHFIPRRAGAVVEGYKLRNLKHNGVLKRLSLEEGDIILKLNDVLVTDKKKLFPMMMGLAGSDNIQLVINRNGETVALEFRLN